MGRRDLLQLLLLSAVWGASFILIEITGRSFPPAWVALLRLSFGAAFLWSVLWLRRRTLPPRRLIGTLLLVALFNNAIPFCLFALGEQTVPSGIAAVLNATMPIWTLLLTPCLAVFCVARSSFRSPPSGMPSPPSWPKPSCKGLTPSAWPPRSSPLHG